MYIFIFHNTFVGLMSLVNDILALTLLLHLQPHLSHYVFVNILLKSFSCDSFSPILSKMLVSNCLILQVFYQSPVTSVKTSPRTTVTPLNPPMPAQQTNVSGDFFAFYLVNMHKPFFCTKGKSFLLQLCLPACRAALPTNLAQLMWDTWGSAWSCTLFLKADIFSPKVLMGFPVSVGQVLVQELYFTL